MKIDTSKFENYENLSAEEKVALLEAYEMPEAQPDTSSTDEISRLKNIISKANSEASEYKKKYQATLSEQERLEAERAEKEAAREARIAELERKEAISAYKANFLSTGYSPELAESSAQAMVDGDNTKVFEDMRLFVDAKMKQLQAEALNNQPTLTNGSPVATPTPEDALTAEFRRAVGL